MKIHTEGDGSFGSFLKSELPHYGFGLFEDAKTVILAVPISAYEEMGAKYKDRHIVNVCSVQKPSTDILLKYTNKITSIHPLFGARTPANKRNTIPTRLCECFEEEVFLDNWRMFSPVLNYMNTVEHDLLMHKTHVAAVKLAKLAKPFVEDVKTVPDEHLPHSFRLLKEFVKTLDDMPEGTMESIMANPFI